MATVSNVRLTMGRTRSENEFGKVSFSVHFSHAEVAQNLAFGLYTAIIERDDNLDYYTPTPNGAFNFSLPRLTQGDADEYIAWLESKVVRPDGQGTRFFTVQGQFNVGNQDIGNEEYRAFVNIIPEITSGQAWSNEVSINLG